MKDNRMAIVMAILMITFIGFGIIIPVMPEIIHAVDPNGAEIHTGLMLALYSAVGFIMSPLWGRWSDRIGRRPILLVGLVGFSVSFLLFGLAGESLLLMYLSRAMGGLFSGAVASVIVAYVADITPPEKRTKGMGLVGMSIGLGFTFGPGFGGLLSDVSNETPFFTAAVLSFITFLFAVVKLKESLEPHQRKAGTGKKVSRWKAFQGPLKYLYVLAFFVTFTLAGMEATLQFFGMNRFDVTPRQVGLLFFVVGIVGALVQGGFVRRKIKKGEEPRYIALGLVLSAGGFFLLLFAHSLSWTILSLVVFGIGNALIRPCVTSLITQKTQVGQGAASGLSSAMDSLGRVAGPLLGSMLFTVEMGLPYLLGGILCMLALLLVMRFRQLDSVDSDEQQLAARQ
ncbi:MFS transporter [Paenibacillus sp. J5C_2022]|uniref:MFS transporter n=1 Tax=Paenibacillus sp. J5C2022 TaxID=2977129 RepID=UPI0021CE3736|nr:MFS transporter [Paenibacillus sp. J5C2022]MCU6709005.1 MFS transporter [Paenibacillus sp. J5C2022]